MTNLKTQHTPGPWRWELNEKSKQLQLCGGRSPFDLTVLDFVRWGMGEATARFRADVDGINLMHHARDFAVVVPGREHHADWFKGLKHPDASLIEASPDLLASLVEQVDAFDRQVAEYRRGDSEEIARIAEQVHGKRMDRARAAIAKARGGR